MCPSEAREIASAFGILVAELADTARYSFDDHRKGLPYSLPLERLRHTKFQIQTALAIVIADLTAELVADPVEQVKAFLNATVECSGDLQYFSRQPLRNQGGDDSVYVFAAWVKTCKRCLAESGGDLDVYWRTIDRLIPGLLSDPVLAVARET